MSTVRAFSNNKRVSTGKTMKDGSFLQFYPTKTRFESEAVWREDWKKKSKVSFEEEEDEYADMPPLISVKTNLPVTKTSAPPPPRPQRNETVTVTTTTTKTTTIKKNPRCCVCIGPMGEDHRMCLVQMMRDGVPNFMEEWHIRSGLREPRATPPSSPKKEPIQEKTPPPKEMPSSPPPVARKKKEKKEESLDDWHFQAVKSATLPAGKYYIGDIQVFHHNFYVISNNLNTMLNQLF